MNKDLMMKAAIQFKGVWPENNCQANEQRIGLCLDSYREDGVYEKGSFYVVGCEATPSLWSIVCTREQFEDFVESLFDGAPEGATHVDAERVDDYYKYDGYAYHLIGKIHSVRCAKFDKLIPRPAKKAPILGDTPQQLKGGVTPWVPEVGEECESALVGSGFRVGQLLYKSEKLIVWQDAGTGDETANRPEHRIFRPLRTERELFIEQATKDYLDQVGSDAVNAKWFERIFGALYDAGNLIYKN